MKVLDAQFSQVERVRRLVALGNPEIETVGTCPELVVLRRNGQKIGLGYTLDVAIADAESNIESYIRRNPTDTKKVGKARLGTIVCRKTA
jgi:hypothetical protein